MKYALALLHSWFWHLTYGMWMGYRETKFQDGEMIYLTSTDRDWNVVKTFYESHPKSGISNSTASGGKDV